MKIYLQDGKVWMVIVLNNEVERMKQGITDIMVHFRMDFVSRLSLISTSSSSSMSWWELRSWGRLGSGCLKLSSVVRQSPLQLLEQTSMRLNATLSSLVRNICTMLSSSANSTLRLICLHQFMYNSRINFFGMYERRWSSLYFSLWTRQVCTNCATTPDSYFTLDLLSSFSFCSCLFCTYSFSSSSKLMAILLPPVSGSSSMLPSIYILDCGTISYPFDFLRIWPVSVYPRPKSTGLEGLEGLEGLDGLMCFLGGQMAAVRRFLSSLAGCLGGW